MSSYTISPTLNKSRVFILQKSELEKRFDPMYYAHEYNHYDKKLSKKPFKKFHQILKSINNGYDFRDYKESGTPYLKVANVKQGELDFTKIQYIDFNSSEISKNIQLKKGNLLLTRKGTFGNAFALDKDYDFVISSEVFYIELQDNSINPKFLEIFFNSKIGQAQFDKNKIGAIMGSLSQEAIRDLKIPFPSSEIQNQIVGIYESYVAQKQKNEAEAEKLLSSIDDYLLKELGIKLPEPPENTLKHRMFVTKINELSGSRFDPFYNLQFFKEFFKEIGNGKFPIKSMKEICIIGSGAIIHTSEYLNEGIPLIRIQNIQHSGIELDDLKYISQEAAYKNLSSQILEGDLLFGMSGTIGRVAVAQENLPFCILNQRIAKVQVCGNTDKVYLQAVLNSLIGINQFKRIGTGGIQINIGIPEIQNLKIPVPPLDKQKEIAEHITGIRQQAQQLKDKTKELLKKASEEIEEILIGKE